MSRSHGHTRGGQSPTYRTWVNMWTRCTNPNATQYKWYGAQGVQVCARWKSFEVFIADVGERPSLDHTLDRFPNKDGNYEPGNVRWATRREQCRNRKSTRAVFRSDGEQFASMAEAAEVVGGTIGGIWDVCTGKRKQHRGFGWSYA